MKQTILENLSEDDINDNRPCICEEIALIIKSGNSYIVQWVMWLQAI